MGPLRCSDPPRGHQRVAPKGFTVIDHLTNNVHKGTMGRGAEFYKGVCGFTEVRYFDIRGAETGLTSYALRLPCGRFCIPINEAGEKKSQINQYLDEYNGPGIQHLAFLTDDLLASLDALRGTPIGFLDIDDDCYAGVFERVPNVTDGPRAHPRAPGAGRRRRQNHRSFGEGNFGALFRSIERDPAKRGVFSDG